MVPMTILDGTYRKLNPPQHRITRLDTEESLHYYGRTYDNYPRPDGTLEVSSDGYERRYSRPEDTYLVEVLDEEGRVTHDFDLLTRDEFREQYQRIGVEYGVSVTTRRNDVVELGGDIGLAIESLKDRGGESASLSIVERPTPPEPDDWTILPLAEARERMLQNVIRRQETGRIHRIGQADPRVIEVEVVASVDTMLERERALLDEGSADRDEERW